MATFKSSCSLFALLGMLVHFTQSQNRCFHDKQISSFNWKWNNAQEGIVIHYATTPADKNPNGWIWVGVENISSKMKFVKFRWRAHWLNPISESECPTEEAMGFIEPGGCTELGGQELANYKHEQDGSLSITYPKRVEIEILSEVEIDCNSCPKNSDSPSNSKLSQYTTGSDNTSSIPASNGSSSSQQSASTTSSIASQSNSDERTRELAEQQEEKRRKEEARRQDQQREREEEEQRTNERIRRSQEEYQQSLSLMASYNVSKGKKSFEAAFGVNYPVSYSLKGKIADNTTFAGDYGFAGGLSIYYWLTPGARAYQDNSGIECGAEVVSTGFSTPNSKGALNSGRLWIYDVYARYWSGSFAPTIIYESSQDSFIYNGNPAPTESLNDNAVLFGLSLGSTPADKEGSFICSAAIDGSGQKICCSAKLNLSLIDFLFTYYSKPMTAPKLGSATQSVLSISIGGAFPF